MLELATAEAHPAKTMLCFLSDKEESGSIENTGADARVFENFIASLYAKTSNSYTEMNLRFALSKSSMLSANVNAAFVRRTSLQAQRSNPVQRLLVSIASSLRSSQ